MYNCDLLFSAPGKTKVFITAEIGINHKGNFDLARKHIEAAKTSGADAVKFQVYKTEKFYNKKILPQAYDLFKSFELSFDQFFRLKEFAGSLDIVFYATPFDNDSLNFLAEIESPVIKVASSDITNEPFLHRISSLAKKNKFSTFISTGFASLKEIKKAVEILKDFNVALEYCVSKYPAENTDFDLKFIETLINSFYVPIGFSDHSTDIFLSLGAVSLGAKMIERHFTVDNEIEGADHSISLNPQKFAHLVKGIRTIEGSIGTGQKKLTQFEKDITYNSMRSMYSVRSINKGDIIEEDDIIFLRPGYGILYKDYKRKIGKKALRNIEQYEKI